MAILFLSDTFDNFDNWKKQILEYEPSLDLREWEDHGDLSEISVVLAWNPKGEYISQIPNLKLIQSLGMGVDHLLHCRDVARDTPVARIVDEDMKEQMAEYVLYGVLKALKNIQIYNTQQTLAVWKPQPRIDKEDLTVGVLGFGELGQAVSLYLKNFGVNVQAWMSTLKIHEDIKCYSGKKGLEDLLTTSNVLVCLLPLTEATKEIINKDSLGLLPKNSYVINVARGGHIKDEDLLELIKEGHISGALLDVFSCEPLPVDHEFWKNPNIEITPHVSANANPKTAVKQIVENIYRVKKGLSPFNVVSLDKGY